MVLQDQENQRNDEPTSAIRAKPFPARGVHQPETMVRRGAVVLKELRRWRRQVKFVLVNDRTPRPQSFCALCCEPIGGSYLREIATRLSYCDHKCYAGRQELTAPALTNIVRGCHHVVETQSFVSTY